MIFFKIFTNFANLRNISEIFHQNFQKIYRHFLQVPLTFYPKGDLNLFLGSFCPASKKLESDSMDQACRVWSSEYQTKSLSPLFLFFFFLFVQSRYLMGTLHLLSHFPVTLGWREGDLWCVILRAILANPCEYCLDSIFFTPYLTDKRCKIKFFYARQREYFNRLIR